MRKQVKKFRNVIVVLVAVWVVSISMATAWAAITVVHSDQDAIEVAQKTVIENSAQKVDRARAPEPGTLVLFGEAFWG